MILLEGTLLRPLPIEQVNLKIYLPSNKIYLSQTTERDLSSPAKYSHWLFLSYLELYKENIKWLYQKKNKVWSVFGHF